MPSTVTTLDPNRYEKVLTLGAVLMVNLLIISQVAGFFLSLCLGYLGSTATQPPWNRFQGVLLTVAVLGVLYFAWRVLWKVGRIGNQYLEYRARRILSRRRDAVVDPLSHNTIFVELLEREKIGRPALDDASDVGFLLVDPRRRRILFEGGATRWFLEADDVVDCFPEKLQTGDIQRHLVLLYVDLGDDNEPVEMCFSPRYSSGKFGNRKRMQQIEEIVDGIHAIMREG